MPKKLTNVALQNKVADALQELVRLKAADADGYVTCVTCDKRGYWRGGGMQGGHFIERSKVRIIEENIHPQCQGCNKWQMKKTSTVLKYRNYMVDMYGEDFVQELEVMANKPIKYSMPDLRDLLALTKKQIKELREEKGL